jgi:hypothetical protein
MNLFSDRNLKILQGICKNKKFANGYVFYGLQGSFKNEAAKFFAKSMNCLNYDSVPCNECENCVAFEKGSFIDFYEIKTPKMINIANIRDAQEAVKYGVANAERLVVVIHAAERCTREAANAFLKTLEEPPNGVCFILMTNNLSSILPTIRSRCQLIDFPVISSEKIEKYLADKFDKSEKKEVLEKCHYNYDLINYYLETQEFLDFPFISFPELMKLNIEGKFNYAELLAKNKNQAILVMTLWVREIFDGFVADNNRKGLESLRIVIENIEQMKYNLNLRLHFDSLMVRLAG